MKSQRQKRQAEIEKIMRESDARLDPDIAFQDEVRRTAAAIIEREASRIQKSERFRRRKKSITPLTAGVWLLMLGAVGFIFSVPGLAAVFFLCGIAGIAWATFSRVSTPSLPIHKNVSAYSRSLKSSLSRFFKKTSRR